MQLRERQPRRTCAIGGQVSLGMLSKKSADCTCMRVQVSSNIWHLRSHPDLIHNAGKRKAKPILSRPVLPFCPLWLHTLICLNSPELHCWLSAHPRCIKMLGCFRVYVRRSRKPGTDPAKDSMPRACRRGQGRKASSICVKPQQNQNTKHVKHQGQEENKNLCGLQECRWKAVS